MLEDGELETASIFGKRLFSLTNSYPAALDEVRDLFDLTIIRDLEKREGIESPGTTRTGLRSWRTRGAHSWHPPLPDDAQLSLGEGTQRILRASSQAVPGEISRAQEAGGQYAVVDATEWV